MNTDGHRFLACVKRAGRLIVIVALLACVGLLVAADKPGSKLQAGKTFQQANNEAAQKSKKPAQTIMGLKQALGVEYLIANCIGCHSPRLIASHHLSRKRWDETMVAMNKKHGLWKLSPEMKGKILDYLAENQGPLGDQEFKEPPWAQPLYRPNPIW